MKLLTHKNARAKRWSSMRRDPSGQHEVIDVLTKLIKLGRTSRTSVTTTAGISNDVAQFGK
jgi:hypothetical protein